MKPIDSKITEVIERSSVNSSEILTSSNKDIMELNSSGDFMRSSTAKGMDDLQSSSPINKKVKSRR